MKLACRECQKPLPRRPKGRRGRDRHYCDERCKGRHRKRLWALGRKAAAAGLK